MGSQTLPKGPKNKKLTAKEIQDTKEFLLNDKSLSESTKKAIRKLLDVELETIEIKPDKLPYDEAVAKNHLGYFRSAEDLSITQDNLKNIESITTSIDWSDSELKDELDKLEPSNSNKDDSADALSFALKNFGKTIKTSQNFSENVDEIVKGVGKDAPLTTNKNGGQQSETQYECEIVDPDFIDILVKNEMENKPHTEDEYSCYASLSNISRYMKYVGLETPEKPDPEPYLTDAIRALATMPQVILETARVMKEGALKYGINNWRRIPREQHINHAIIHLLAYLSDDKQDDHYAHAICRLSFAIATKLSDKFRFTNILSKEEWKELIS